MHFGAVFAAVVYSKEKNVARSVIILDVFFSAPFLKSSLSSLVDILGDAFG